LVLAENRAIYGDFAQIPAIFGLLLGGILFSGFVKTTLFTLGWSLSGIVVDKEVPVVWPWALGLVGRGAKRGVNDCEVLIAPGNGSDKISDGSWDEYKNSFACEG
jgi:hypothetical protein